MIFWMGSWGDGKEWLNSCHLLCSLLDPQHLGHCWHKVSVQKVIFDGSLSDSLKVYSLSD